MVLDLGVITRHPAIHGYSLTEDMTHASPAFHFGVLILALLADQAQSAAVYSVALRTGEQAAGATTQFLSHNGAGFGIAGISGPNGLGASVQSDASSPVPHSTGSSTLAMALVVGLRRSSITPASFSQSPAPSSARLPGALLLFPSGLAWLLGIGARRRACVA